MTALLLATDFDGTIAPIVASPDAAELHPEARPLLDRLAGAGDVTLAIVSGRDLADLRERTRGVRAILSGSHGLECSDADGHLLWTAVRRMPEVHESVLRELARAGVTVEQKKFSLALHYRAQTQEPRDVLDWLSAWARVHDLEVIAGRKVLEARVPGGGKAYALRKLAERTAAQRVVYAGDDTTDFAALEVAAQLGAAYFVESSERAAPEIPGLIRVKSIEELLGELARLRPH